MKRILSLLLVVLLAGPASADEIAADDPLGIVMSGDSVSLEDFLWLKRPIIVFADNPADPRYAEQMELLLRDAAALDDRDVVVLTDTDPAAQSALRRKLRPRGFMLVLIGKDGQVDLRKPSPWSVREISRVIDKTPSRQRELRERRGS